MAIKRKLVIGFAAGLVIVGVSFWIYERPRTTDVPFRSLVPQRVDYSPGAPEGFPDCTLDIVDMRTDHTNAHLDVTFRPKAGTQCGIPVYPRGWWIDANGERFERRPPERAPDGRLLLHGDNGAQDTGGIASMCTIEAPVTYFIELGGEPIEIGTIEKQLECYRDRNEIYATYMLSRPYGLETPAGSLDGAIEAPSVDGEVLSFVWAMHNDTDSDIELSRCPFVDIELQDEEEEREGKGFRTYVNCVDAPDLVEPGDTVRFEIEAPLDEVGSGDVVEVELHDESRVLYRVTRRVDL